MTNEILHVHHWHKQKIYCSDPKTNKEDLPDIECCCRCTLEREIITGPFNSEKGKKLFHEVDLGYKVEKDRLRKLEQKREFEGAKHTLATYHARKTRNA